jgi:O-methyltransferase
MLRQFSQYAAQLDGDFAECGCYRGGTAWLLGESSQGKDGRKLHLFDTFEGMPLLADSDPGGHKKGDFGDTSLESVKELLSGYNNVEYHPGFIPNTFEGFDGKFSFVHVDVDLFETSSACYEFFYPRMVTGGIMICDDYGFRKYETSARKAVDTFFANKPEVVVTLPTGQALVIKL